MDEQGRMTDEERRAFEPEPCPKCGSKNITVDWQDLGTGGAGRWLPGLKLCRDCRGTGEPWPPDPFA
jgi:hypothetical protein